MSSRQDSAMNGFQSRRMYGSVQRGGSEPSAHRKRSTSARRGTSEDSSGNEKGGGSQPATETFSNLWMEPWENIRFIFVFVIIFMAVDFILFLVSGLAVGWLSDSLSSDQLKDPSVLHASDILRFDSSGHPNATSRSPDATAPFLHRIQMKEVIMNPFGWDTAAAESIWGMTEASKMSTSVLAQLLSVGLLLLLLPCRGSKDIHQRRDQALVLVAIIIRAISEYSLVTEGTVTQSVLPQVSGLAQGYETNVNIGFQYMGFFASRALYYSIMLILVWSVSPRRGKLAS